MGDANEALARCRCVIFDVDGTLYDQRRLRMIMGARLVGYYSVRPHRLGELALLKRFRRRREAFAESQTADVERMQYGEIDNADAARTKELAQHWLHTAPLRHLRGCVHSALHDLMEALRGGGLRIAVFSDYPAKEKLSATGVAADYCICSSEIGEGRLKPSPAGLIHICGQFGLAPHECLVVGDRDDRDGEAARRAAMPYVIVPSGIRDLEAAEILRLAGLT